MFYDYSYDKELPYYITFKTETKPTSFSIKSNLNSYPKEKEEKELEENKSIEDNFSKKEDSQDENSKNMKTLSPGRSSHKIFSYNDKNNHFNQNKFLSPFKDRKKSSGYCE